MILEKYKLLIPAFLLAVMPLFSLAAVNKSADTVLQNDKIYTFVEVQPAFLGGIEALNAFLKRTANYPASDQENKIEGRVYVNFIVEKDGSLTNIKAIRGPSESLKSEAIRVLKLSPKWKPGMQGGQEARVSYTEPIVFNLDNVSIHAIAPPGSN